MDVKSDVAKKLLKAQSRDAADNFKLAHEDAPTTEAGFYLAGYTP